MDNTQYQLLVIDDDDRVRQSAVAYLEDSGFAVLEANSGSAGLELFSRCHPDLVITDLKMPDMDGIALLQAVRLRSENVPLIVISGAGTMDDVVNALRLGATDYLIKPILNMATLEHSIVRGLERARLIKENQRYRAELEEANAELKNHLAIIEQDQQAGLFVQQCLLPVTPFTAMNYTFSHYLKPSLYLSGDTIDYAIIDKRYWAFYLADVSGHGSAPAFVAIWLKNLVRQLIRNEHYIGLQNSIPDAISQLLGVINDELIDTGLNHHLTCFVGIVDTEADELYYAVAGHLPLPILITQESCCYLEGRGKPLGLFKHADWEIYQLQTAPEFSILCFSDGVLEILPPTELSAKEEALLEMVKATGGHLSSIKAMLTEDKIATAPDDIAILSVCKDID